jgi:hypothetical protein
MPAVLLDHSSNHGIMLRVGTNLQGIGVSWLQVWRICRSIGFRIVSSSNPLRHPPAVHCFKSNILYFGFGRCDAIVLKKLSDFGYKSCIGVAIDAIDSVADRCFSGWFVNHFCILQVMSGCSRPVQFQGTFRTSEPLRRGHKELAVLLSGTAGN